MPRRISRGLLILNIKRHFHTLNPYDDLDEIDWDMVDYPCKFEDALRDFKDGYPQFKWFKEEFDLQLKEDEARAKGNTLFKSVRIDLKLYLQKSKKGDEYAYVKGTIPKKYLDVYKDRLYKEYYVDWKIQEDLDEFVDPNPEPEPDFDNLE